MTKILDDLTGAMMAKRIVSEMYDMLKRNGYSTVVSTSLIKHVVKEMKMNPDQLALADLENPRDEYEAKANLFKAFKVYFNMSGKEFRDVTDDLYNISLYYDLPIHDVIAYCPLCNEMEQGVHCGYDPLSGFEVYECEKCLGRWRYEEP